MLNKSKPFGQVCGHDHAIFYQAGKHFNAAGEEINIKTGKVIEKVKADTKPVETPAPSTVITPSFISTKDDAIMTLGDENNPAPIELEALPYQEIKKRVEQAGGIWSNKEVGILYLRGLE